MYTLYLEMQFLHEKRIKKFNYAISLYIFSDNMQVLSLAAISLGLVNVGSGDSDVSSTILLKLLGLPMEKLIISYSRFL